MALNIISGNQAIEVKQVKNLIYGQPGVGKSSIGFTASRPLCLDFDKGVYRSQYRKDSVDIGSWADIARISPDDLRNYDTIIIDTLGRCLDFLTGDIVNNDSKMARRDGALTMQGYGALKSRFTKWINQLTLFGKDIIMIAHDREDKDGDNRIIRPDITGGSYGEIMKLVDFIAYYYQENEKRMLNFNPTEKFVGKNSARLPAITVPDFQNEPDFMAKLIHRQKSSLGQSANAQLSSEEIVKYHKQKIDSLLNLEQYNMYMRDVGDLYKQGKQAEFEQTFAIMKSSAEAKGIVYDNGSKKFIKEVKQHEPAPEPTPEMATAGEVPNFGF